LNVGRYMSIAQTSWLVPADVKAVMVPDGSMVARKSPVKR